jgi:hypothetical protein
MSTTALRESGSFFSSALSNGHQSIASVKSILKLFTFQIKMLKITLAEILADAFHSEPHPSSVVK